MDATVKARPVSNYVVADDARIFPHFEERYEPFLLFDVDFVKYSLVLLLNSLLLLVVLTQL